MAQTVKTFKGGIHPLHRNDHGKTPTKNRPVEVLPAPATVVIPLVQHIGAPAAAVVSEGDAVSIGQVIGKADGFVSVNVHASVSGQALVIEKRPHPSGTDVLSVVIKNDFKDTMAERHPVDYLTMQPRELTALLQQSGIVGLGGATFPTHVKLSPPEDKQIDTLIVNGAECEPYLTSDYRIMLDKSADVIYGIQAVMHILRLDRAFVGVEDNKPECIDMLNRTLKEQNISGIQVVPLKTKYPQGGEKQLIKATTGREVPSGGLPMDVGCVVHNTGTLLAVAEALRDGKPLYERVVTVTGAVREPKNLLVRLGTPFAHVIEQCGGIDGEKAAVISGGPMMGWPQYDLNAPVIKSTTGLLALNEAQMTSGPERNCIRCARCVDACPVGLEPYLLYRYAQIKEFEKTRRHHAADCMECGCCSYICPSKRHLVQGIKLAKKAMVTLNGVGEGK